ncbi:MAG: tetratricopeptide repeat protein [Gemmatimonadales bacterium]
MTHPTILALAVLAGQLPEAEEAFRRGDYRAARAGYEAVLARDSANVRAWYRLAVLDSWDGRLRQSLARFARLRRLEPVDPDVMVAHARVLAWAGRTRESEWLYDSVLVRAPGRADALAGRARAVAWSGDLDRAERLWRDALAARPDDPELLIGLAQTLFWQGRPDLAESYAARARRLAPEDRAARDLLDLVRAAFRPELATVADYAYDSDDNAFVAQQGAFATSLTNGLRVTLQAGWRRATDPVRAGASYGGGGYVIAALGRGAVLRAGLGARRLEPEAGAARTPLTAQLGLGLRPARNAAVSIAYSRSPFDETALLIERGFRIDALDFSLDASPGPRLSLSGGGGVAWLSDGNRRAGGVVSLMVSTLPGLQLGAQGRVMGYREPNPGRGYFAPDRFAVFEGRVVHTWRRGRWGARTDGGLGVQQVGRGADAQTEWHAGITLSRGWGANSELALVGAMTNSAASSAVGAFRYGTVGIRLRQGL